MCYRVSCDVVLGASKSDSGKWERAVIRACLCVSFQQMASFGLSPSVIHLTPQLRIWLKTSLEKHEFVQATDNQHLSPLMAPIKKMSVGVSKTSLKCVIKKRPEWSIIATAHPHSGYHHGLDVRPVVSMSVTTEDTFFGTLHIYQPWLWGNSPGDLKVGEIWFLFDHYRNDKVEVKAAATGNRNGSPGPGSPDSWLSWAWLSRLLALWAPGSPGSNLYFSQSTSQKAWIWHQEAFEWV